MISLKLQSHIVRDQTKTRTRPYNLTFTPQSVVAKLIIEMHWGKPEYFIILFLKLFKIIILF